MKKIMVDIYHPVFRDDGFYIESVTHLKALEIVSSENGETMVSRIREMILEQYNDGLLINMQEFKDIAYLNIFIFFGKRYDFLIDYFQDIDAGVESEKIYEESGGTEEILLSVDYLFDQKDIDSVCSLIENYEINTEIYCVETKSFEKGAGDWQTHLILLLKDGLVAVGSGLLIEKVKKQLNWDVKDLEKIRIEKVNVDDIKEYISERAHINKRDLKLVRSERQMDYKLFYFTNRYKDFEIKLYESGEIDYDVKDKSQMMI